MSDSVVNFTCVHVRAFRTVCNLPLASALADGAFFETTPLFTSKALGLTEKPVKALNKFRKREALISRETMSPPVDGELFYIVPHLGESFQKICLIQRTGVA